MESKPTKRPVGRPKQAETVVVCFRVLKEWREPVKAVVREEINRLKIVEYIKARKEGRG